MLLGTYMLVGLRNAFYQHELYNVQIVHYAKRSDQSTF